MEYVEHVRFGDQLYAIIVRASFREPGITFFSSPGIVATTRLHEPSRRARASRLIATTR